MKLLKFEHIAPYLFSNLQMIGKVGQTETLNLRNMDHALRFWKPILRPLSDEAIKEYFTPLFESDVDARSFLNEQYLQDKGFDFIEEMLQTNPEWWGVGTFNLLVKHHFDVFSLIDKKLAHNLETISHENN